MKTEAALTAAARVLTMLTAAASAVVTARALGVEARGNYFYIVTLALLAAQFATLGLTSSNAYFAANNPNLKNRLLANSLWVSILLGPLFAVLVLAGDAFVAPISTRSLGQLLWVL